MYLLHVQNTLSTPPPLIDISPFECTKIQQDELETLRAIYNGDIKCFSDSCFTIRVKFLTNDILEEDVIGIWFRYAVKYCLVCVIQLLLAFV